MIRAALILLTALALSGCAETRNRMADIIAAGEVDFAGDPVTLAELADEPGVFAGRLISVPGAFSMMGGQACLTDRGRAIAIRLTEVIDNYPSRLLAGIMRFTAPSSGRNGRAPDDQLAQRVSNLVTQDTETRARLMQGLYIGSVESSEVARLERAFKAVTAAEPLYRKRRHDEALTEAETRQLEEAESFVREIVEVDSFEPEVLTGVSGAPAAKHAAE